MKLRGRVVIACLLIISFLSHSDTGAEEAGAPRKEIESLDGQVQKLKEEILDLNTLLFRLQEDLLFPEDSSVVVFLAIDGGNYFGLDSVKLNLDDKLVSSYLYTDREVGALKKGGIQRLYMGNVKSGEHQLVAVFTGKGPQEKDYKRAETVRFSKGDGASFIKIIIKDSTQKEQPEFVHETWN
jgi:hypothetical protein